jgi:hypothetical protein
MHYRIDPNYDTIPILWSTRFCILYKRLKLFHAMEVDECRSIKSVANCDALDRGVYVG